jgi:ssDNA-binding protein
MTATPAPKLITPEFRVSFANVFRPQAPIAGSKADAKPKYGLTMLFGKDADLTALKQAAHAAAVEKFGDKLKDPNFAKRLRSPFRDQGEKTFEGYVAGCVFINATSSQRPGLVDSQVQLIIEEAQFYSGCYAIASVNAFAYDTAGNVGVAFGVNNIQKLRDGDPLGGRTRPEDDFKPAAAPAGGNAATGLFA